MAQNSPAAHFVDGNKEIQEIIDKDQNSLADVRRLETLLKLKFPKKKVQEEEVSLQSQLDSIRQGEKSLRTYYLECVEVVNLLASDLPSSGIPVGNNQIWAVSRVVEKFLHNLTDERLKRTVLTQFGVYKKSLPEV
ncbi:hypothetical protein K3495_g4763 [Podosphaera aphanis]|nr:hypothetical protein K3495_g4763 [Podosphaera aphanis]